MENPAAETIPNSDALASGSGRCQRHWLDNDPVATAVYNGLSLIFPRAEGFAIESVKRYRDGVPKKLAMEIQAFTSQEAMHTREHARLNQHILDAGYDISRINTRMNTVLADARDMPDYGKLAATMILEHATAIGANQLLSNDAHLAGADKDVAALWRWHSVEEIEHKAVVYDVWLEATKTWSAWRRWKTRSILMITVTTGFCRQRWLDSIDLLEQDGLQGTRVRLSLLWFLFGKPGIARKLFLPWIRFLRPGFHPWRHDDRSLIGLKESKYSDAISSVAESSKEPKN